MIGIMNLFPFRFGYINEQLWERAFRGAALWAIIFGALSLLVLFNYFEFKEILNHKFS